MLLYIVLRIKDKTKGNGLFYNSKNLGVV